VKENCGRRDYSGGVYLNTTVQTRNNTGQTKASSVQESFSVL